MKVHPMKETTLEPSMHLTMDMVVLVHTLWEWTQLTTLKLVFSKLWQVIMNWDSIITRIHPISK